MNVWSYNLNPKPPEDIVKQEKARLRRLRLQQVAERSKLISADMRQRIQRERHKQFSLVKQKVKEELTKEKLKRHRELLHVYKGCAESIGSGHRQAEAEAPSEEKRMQTQQAYTELALKRGKDAMQLLKLQQEQKAEAANRHILARQLALDQERERTLRIISSAQLKKEMVKAVAMNDENAHKKGCACRQCLLQPWRVERSELDPQEPNAREAAVDIADRERELQSHQKKLQEDRDAVAAMRFDVAHRKVLTDQSLVRLTDEVLKDLDTDNYRRRQLFQQESTGLPLEKASERQENERQRKMEEAVENIFGYIPDVAGRVEPSSVELMSDEIADERTIERQRLAEKPSRDLTSDEIADDRAIERQRPAEETSSSETIITLRQLEPSHDTNRASRTGHRIPDYGHTRRPTPAATSVDADVTSPLPVQSREDKKPMITEERFLPDAAARQDQADLHRFQFLSQDKHFRSVESQTEAPVDQGTVPSHLANRTHAHRQSSVSSLSSETTYLDLPPNYGIPTLEGHDIDQNQPWTSNDLLARYQRHLLARAENRLNTNGKERPHPRL